MRHILLGAEKANISRLYSHFSITASPFFEYFGFTVSKVQQVDVKGVALTNYMMERLASHSE